MKEYQEYGLKLHNWYRKRHGSPKMELNTRLNDAADAYAYKLARMGTLMHTSGLDYNENLYMSFGGNDSYKESVKNACDSWYNEIKFYNFNYPGFSMQTGHFTAMIWSNSTSLGIGCATVGGRTCVVACYKPHANFGYAKDYRECVQPYRDVEDSEEEGENGEEEGENEDQEEDGNEEEAENEEVNEDDEGDEEKDLTVHPTVTCDGCSTAPLTGNRYKCLECLDFDLCQECIGNGTHDEHIFVRLATNDQTQKAYLCHRLFTAAQ